MKLKIAIFGIINALFWLSVKEYYLVAACVLITVWVLTGDD